MLASRCPFFFPSFVFVVSRSCPIMRPEQLFPVVVVVVAVVIVVDDDDDR